MLEYREGGWHRRKILQSGGWGGLALLGHFYKLEQSSPVPKGRLFRKGGLVEFFIPGSSNLFLPLGCLATIFAPVLWGPRWWTVHYRSPRRVISWSNLDRLCMGKSGFHICDGVSIGWEIRKATPAFLGKEEPGWWHICISLSGVLFFFFVHEIPINASLF